MELIFRPEAEAELLEAQVWIEAAVGETTLIGSMFALCLTCSSRIPYP